MVLVQVNNLKKTYNNKIVLNNISCTFNENDRIGIVGPNGNGKTTFCEILARLRPFDSGEIKIKPNFSFGMQLQENPFPKSVTTWDFCKFYIRSFKLIISEQDLIERFKTLSISEYVHTSVEKLSGGQKQRVNILLATIHNPNILILDELGSGLDFQSKEYIYKYIENIIETTKLLIIVSHDLAEVEKFCNKIIVLIKGEIKIFESTKNIINKYGSLNNYIKKDFKDYYEIHDKYLQGNIKVQKSNLKWKKDLQKLTYKNKIFFKKNRK